MSKEDIKQIEVECPVCHLKTATVVTCHSCNGYGCEFDERGQEAGTCFSCGGSGEELWCANCQAFVG